jgi:hypothetical protein
MLLGFNQRVHFPLNLFWGSVPTLQTLGSGRAQEVAMDFEIDKAAIAHVRETLWDNFWTQGGFGMYPTAFLGFLLLLYAGFYVLRPQERFLRAVAVLAFVTLASGTLGTSVGVMTAFRYAATVAPELAARSACYGSAMALHVVVLALILVIVAGFITGVGMRRQAKQRVTA